MRSTILLLAPTSSDEMAFEPIASISIAVAAGVKTLQSLKAFNQKAFILPSA
ncbi:hypothetical protein [Almyronema epifaneia]|uniref:DJ-1/PfpI domain-containing protein n=1 Tax=Almyronema epifaneia S1 TaxID=2991925 RepID=A0ABW6IJC3_9CYAN